MEGSVTVTAHASRLGAGSNGGGGSTDGQAVHITASLPARRLGFGSASGRGHARAAEEEAGVVDEEKLTGGEDWAGNTCWIGKPETTVRSDSGSVQRADRCIHIHIGPVAKLLRVSSTDHEHV